MVFKQAGLYEEAIKAAEKSLRFASEWELPSIISSLADLYLRTGNYQSAMKILETTEVQGNRYENRILEELIKVYISHQQYDTAQKIAVGAINKYPEYCWLYAEYLVKACKAAGDVTDVFEKVILLYPNTDSLKTLALWYSRIGRYDLLIQRFETLSQDSSVASDRQVFCCRILVEVYLKQREEARAIVALERAINIVQVDQGDDLWEDIHEAALMCGHYDTAIHASRQLILADRHLNFGWILLWQGLNLKFERSIAMKQYEQEVEEWKRTPFYGMIPKHNMEGYDSEIKRYVL